MNKYLLAGCNSFSAGHFIEYLRKKDPEAHITGLDIQESSRYSQLNSYIQLSTKMSSELEDIFSQVKPDYVINFSAIVRGSLSDLLDVNAGLSFELLRLSYACKKILFIGSAAEYGIPESLPITEEHILQPVSDYGRSKKIQTDGIRASKAPWIIARPFNIIGPGLSDSLVIAAFIKRFRASSDGTIEVGNIKTKRDFVDIRDVVSAYYLLLHSDIQHEVFNISLGYSISIENILNEIAQAAGREIQPQVNPDFIRDNDVMDIYGSYEKLRKAIGWTPAVSVSDSIRDMWNADA